MLTLLATPIGNLEDISKRAIDALTHAEVIACEDTRVTEKLLNTLEIRGALTRATRPKYISYHKHNESESTANLISLLKDGQKILLVSDAGTPAIADPGQKIVEACHKENIAVTIIPGPCAFISAIALSGFQAEAMQFIGFLPKAIDDRKIALKEISEYQGISCAYETAERIYDTLHLLSDLIPERPIAFIRELTKKFEEVCVTTISQLRQQIEETTKRASIKGEITLVLHPPLTNELRIEKNDSWYIAAVHTMRKEMNIPLTEACQLVAKAHGIKKRWLYTLILNSQELS